MKYTTIHEVYVGINKKWKRHFLPFLLLSDNFRPTAVLLSLQQHGLSLVSHEIQFCRPVLPEWWIGFGEYYWESGVIGKVNNSGSI